MDTIALIIIGLLALMLVVKDYFGMRERSEYLDRLMARSLPEYKDNTKPEANDFTSTKDNLPFIEEAREEIVNGTDED